MMRILLADDHAMFRSGLRRLLEDEFRDAVFGEVADCDGLIEAVRAEAWDLLVLDISLAGHNSLHELPRIKQIRPALPVIVLSMYGERQFVVRALGAGAGAYLTKERAADELFRAIRAVLDGRRYIGEALAEQLADHVAMDTKGKPHESLSPRELEVFLLLASAISVSTVAERLGLSVKTVSTYRTRILEKMALSSNAEIIQYAVRHGLVA